VNILLDTNACIVLINGTSERVRERFSRAVREGVTLATSSIVAHELWYGVAKSERREQNARRLHEFLSRFISVLDFTPQDAQSAGEIRATLERRGERIGEYDTLIAGQALCRNLLLITANTREFRRVDGLRTDDWTVD
jgi:tRNA(fMet)-specific endonuclease VapC